MRLLDLHPQLYRLEVRVERQTRVLGDPLKWKSGDPTEDFVGPREYNVPVTLLAEAGGIMFECPVCRDHKILCWFRDRGIPDSTAPKPGRWKAIGTDLNDLTLGPGLNGKSSVLLEGGCNAHFNVVNGEVIPPR